MKTFLIAILGTVLAVVSNAGAASVRNVRAVDTVAELLTLDPRALSRDGAATLYVSGITRTNEWPIRAIVYDAASSATTNGATFASTNWPGRWYFPDRISPIQALEWWGGGTGVADNTAALTAAASWVGSLGGGWVTSGAGTYTFLAGDTLTLPSGVRLRGAGPNATVWNFTSATPTTNYQPAIRWVGSISGSVRLREPTVAGSRTLALSSSVDWSYGDRIQLRNTNDFSFGSRWYYNAGEFNTVYSNTGGTNISLVEPLEDVYPTNYTVANKVTPTTGSAEGIRFSWHEKSGGIQLDYADQESYLEDCEGAGSEDKQFDVRRSYGVLLSRLKGDWDSDPSSGLGYILTVGDSENVTVEHCYFRSSRHAISGGGSTIPTRYLNVVNCDIGSTRQDVAGADFHENVVQSSFVNCFLPSGVSLGGGRNTLENCRVRNGLQNTAVGVAAARYYDWTIRHNEIEITPFGGAQTVWGIRLYLQPGSQSGYPASTNYWPGTFGATESQRIRITDNVIRFVGVATNNNYAVFVDEASTLGANTNFPAAMFAAPEFEGNEIFFDPAQPVAALTTPGVVFALGPKIRWPGLIARNNYLGGGPLNVITTGGTLVFTGNTVANSFTDTGCYIYTSPSTNLWMPADVIASDNDFGASIGSAMSFGNLGGEVTLRNNRVANHGSGGGTYGRFAFPLFETSNPYTLVEADGNRISSTNSPTHDYYVGASVAPMYETWTQLGGSTTKGTRPAAGSHLAIPRLIGAFGATNAVTLLGQYAALPTPTLPGLAHQGGDLWYSNGSSWTNFLRSGTTNFPALYVSNAITSSSLITGPISSTGPAVVTNSVDTKDLRATAITVGDTWPVTTNGAVRSTFPVYVQGNTNELMRLSLVNTSTGNQSGSGVQVSAYNQAVGRFSALATNNSTAARVARVATDAISGAGLGYDLYYPGSMDIRWTYGGGTEFARLDTNNLSVPGLTTLSSTAVLDRVAGFEADATSTRRVLRTSTMSNLKASLAIASTDITDSTSAGRTLLKAANAAAQRAALGQVAALDLPPSDGYVYGISNGVMARVASGGGGGVSTNLDNLTVTNLASFLNLVKIYDASGASLLVDVASGTVTVYPNLSVQGSVTTGSGGLGVNGPAAFLSTVKQGPSLLDLYSLTSVGINGAAPAPLININDTTPAAPSGSVPARFQVTGTNTSAYVAVAPTVSPSGSWAVVSNTVAWTTVASGTFTATNLPYVGSSLGNHAFGTLYGYVAGGSISARIVIGSTTSFQDSTPTFASSPTERAVSLRTSFVRTSTGIAAAQDIVVSTTVAPTTGESGSYSSAPSVTTRPGIGSEVAWDGSTNITWSIDLQFPVASTNLSVSILSTGLK